jgi:sortase A
VPAATAQLTPLETTVATGVPTTTAAAPAARAAPTSMATTTTTDGVPRQRTQPIAPPGDPDAPEDNPPVGRIAIADIALDEELGEGIRLATLDRGPGHWPGSAMPGEVGNVVIGGHRTSHGAEFRRLHELEPGDEMVLTSAAGSFSYRVSRTEIVGPEALWIVDPTDTATATLFACHPLGSTAERIVVYFDLAT